MENTLHRETVDLGLGVRVDLGTHGATLTAHGYSLALVPKTRQDANRMSIALKKASRRLQAIALTLPEGG